MKRGIFYITVLILAVLSCEKADPAEDMSGFRQEDRQVSVIPNGESKVISFVVDDDLVGFNTKSNIDMKVEALKPETFVTSDVEKAESGGFVSISVDKSFLPNYDSNPIDPDTKASTYITFESQVTDLNSFHVYAYTPGGTPASQMRYAWDEEFTKGADGVFRSVSSREWPDTDPEWSFVATNCPSLHLRNMTSSGNLNATSSIQYKFQVGTSPSYNSVPDAVFAFNYNNTQAEWSNKNTLINNGMTGYTTSSYLARNTLSFKHAYARIGNVTIVNQSGQTVNNVQISLAGTLVSNCYGFGIGTGTMYNILAGNWVNKDDNKAWITSFGPDEAGTTAENLYFIAPTSLLFNVSWEASESSGYQVYNNIPVTVTGLKPGINYNLTFTLGTGGPSTPYVDYFTIVPIATEPGNTFLVFGMKNGVNYNHSALYYSLDGVDFQGFSDLYIGPSADTYYYCPVNLTAGTPIHLKGDMSRDFYDESYFMFVDADEFMKQGVGYTVADRSIQPGHVTRAYAHGNMKWLNLGNETAGDYSNIFNATLYCSVGAVLESCPDLVSQPSYYIDDPEYNIVFPFYDAAYYNNHGVDTYTNFYFNACFKGTHITFLPGAYNAYLYNSSGSVIWPKLKQDFSECFMNCTNLIDTRSVAPYSSTSSIHLQFDELEYRTDHATRTDMFTGTAFAPYL